MSRFAYVAAGVSIAVALAGAAQTAEPAHPALADLAKCADVGDATAKAACYDAATTALNQAVRAGDLILVQKKEAQEAQRGAFGFNLPSLNIFDRVGGSDGGEAKPLESIVSEARSVRRDSTGRWVVELTDGAVWRQIDDITLAPPPRAGSRIEIYRGAFGSYLMKVDKHKGVRAKRSE